MAQISLYVEDSMASQLTASAKISNCSVSKYVAALISKHLSENELEESRKKRILEQLCGALDDPSFEIPPELPWEKEIPRRFDLI